MEAYSDDVWNCHDNKKKWKFKLVCMIKRIQWLQVIAAPYI